MNSRQCRGRCRAGKRMVEAVPMGAAEAHRGSAAPRRLLLARSGQEVRQQEAACRLRG